METEKPEDIERRRPAAAEPDPQPEPQPGPGPGSGPGPDPAERQEQEPKEQGQEPKGAPAAGAPAGQLATGPALATAAPGWSAAVPAGGPYQQLPAPAPGFSAVPRPLQRPAWTRLAEPARAAALLPIVVGGVVLDLAVRSGFVGVGGALLFLVLAVGLLALARPANRQAWVLAAAAAAFGVWLALRTSPWLIPADVLAALALLGLAASFARGGSVLDLGFTGAVLRFGHGLFHAVAGPGYAWEALREPPPAGQDAPAPARSRQAALVAGLALALPLVIVLGALLSSADAVFASYFDLPSIILHLVLFVVGAFATAGMLRLADATPIPPGRPGPRWLGGVEALVVLVMVDLVFAVFTASQVVAASSGGERILRTAGLTYAEYARSGFFQLVAAAGVTVAALLILRAQTRPLDARLDRLVRITGLVTVALTMVLVAVAVRRLDLYTDAYGLTTPRVIVFALNLWIGAVLLALGAALAGLWARRAWLAAATVGSGLVVVLALNAVNPEALTMRWNARTGHLFEQPGAGLTEVPGTDGLPALADAVRGLGPAERHAAAVSIECPVDATGRGLDAGGERYRGWAAANLLRSRAAEARREICAW